MKSKPVDFAKKLKIKPKNGAENIKQIPSAVTKQKDQRKQNRKETKRKAKALSLESVQETNGIKPPKMVENKSKQEEGGNTGKEVVPDAGTDTKYGKGRTYTVSIALPGSILDNAQSFLLKTYLAGQVARAAGIFSVDEIVIFDESKHTNKSVSSKGSSSIHQLGRILQYMECPQYIRKHFFPKHSDLQYAGVLNPLGCPHHMSIDEDSVYREGVIIKGGKSGEGSVVNVGLRKDVMVDQSIATGHRVTVKLHTSHNDKKCLKGTAVSSSTPRTEAGIYWGYSVRLADSLSAVITECPYTDDYDLLIGTSDKGTSVDDLELQQFRHALIVFGGLKGLEASLEADSKLSLDDPKYLFHHYLNTCPNQGSRTIRTEEALLITMSALRLKIEVAQRKCL
ncbi:putative methyltransferase C9orf114 homolog [Argonauta hians]